MYRTYSKVFIEETEETVGTGWLPPMADMGAYTMEHSDLRPERNIKQMSDKLSIPAPKAPFAPPNHVDLRGWCSPIEKQLNLGSCSAHAAVGVVEYFERRAYNRHIDASRLFVYKTTRNLMGVTGDTGAWLRYAMGALRLCGAPPEKYWEYTDRKPPVPAGEKSFDDEPPSFVYSLAENYEALSYFAHDPLGRNIPPNDILNSVKKYLAFGIPSMFGFFGFPSANSGDVPGSFPFPCPGEKSIWGHAVVAVGYDDGIKITNKSCNMKTKGALLIRNSWGTGWGDKGYGWLPYEYVLQRIAMDFWSLIKMEWVDTGNFGLS